MTKEVDINSDGSEGTLTARLSGSPENGGNLNNNVEVSVNTQQRLTVGGGGGFTLEHGFSDGVRIIGSAGVTASLAGNIGTSAQQGQRQHDSSVDSPLRPNAIGIFEAHDILKYVVDKTGGDIGKLTVLQTMDIIEEHPKLLKPKDFANFENIAHKLQSTSGTLAPEITAAQQSISSLHTDILQDPSLNKNPKITGAADALYEASLSLPPSLSQTYTEADPLLNMRLTDVNAIASRTQDFITSKGGAASIGSDLTKAANSFLADASQQQLPSHVVTDIQNVVSKIDTDVTATQIASNLASSANQLMSDAPAQTLPASTASDISGAVSKIDREAKQITDIYSKIPSAEKIREYFRDTDRAIAIDPRLDAAAFAALGVMTPSVKAAVLAQESVAAGVGNVDVIIGDKVAFHPAIERSLRGEIGMGDESLSVSPDMGRKLNLALSDTQTLLGGYVFVQEDKMHWTGIDGERKITTAGIGASISKPFGQDKVAFVNVEAQTSHIDTVTPGNIPAKNNNNGVAITGGIRF